MHYCGNVELAGNGLALISVKMIESLSNFPTVEIWKFDFDIRVLLVECVEASGFAGRECYPSCSTSSFDTRHYYVIISNLKVPQLGF